MKTTKNCEIFHKIHGDEVGVGTRFVFPIPILTLIYLPVTLPIPNGDEKLNLIPVPNGFRYFRLIPVPAVNQKKFKLQW